MNEHPVPRNVTGFQFQLIGFMTLKQFGYFLAGALLAFAFFKAPISFFRFPIAAFFFFVGAAFAFLPVQERPLDVWIMNLLKCIYLPTQFVWEKNVHIPDVFTIKTQSTKPYIAPQSQADTKAKLDSYLATVAPKEEDRLNAIENKTLKNVSDLFFQNIPISKTKQIKTHPQTAPSLSSFAAKLFNHEGGTPKPLAQSAHHTTAPLPIGLFAGLVRTKSGPIPGLLVHILTETNEQSRLLKTDGMGKFSIRLPLEKGIYHLTVEDPNGRYSFRSFPFEVGDQGLHPWLITPIGETN